MPRHGHQLTLFLLACALAVRMLVPAGWMPAATGGAFAIEPCPGAEPAPHLAMIGHHDGAAGHHSHHAQHDGDCAFGALTVGFASADLPAAATPALVTAEPRQAAPEFFFATGPPALPPPATGPPALA
jgi:hypothetical protein